MIESQNITRHLNRRTFLKTVGITSALVTATSCTSAELQPREARRTPQAIEIIDKATNKPIMVIDAATGKVITEIPGGTLLRMYNERARNALIGWTTGAGIGIAATEFLMRRANKRGFFKHISVLGVGFAGFIAGGVTADKVTNSQQAVELDTLLNHQ